MKRAVYIELPNQDPLSSDYSKLETAMYGTRGTLLISQAEVRRVMQKLGFEASVRAPGLHHHKTGHGCHCSRR